MQLPVMPPILPMLAKLARSIPTADGLLYEPKWDGFRCIVFRDGDEIELASRNQRPFNRYFPELIPKLLDALPERCVVDGEIVVPDAGGHGLDFDGLQQRIHPAESRVRMLAEQTPASFVAFDLLALGDTNLHGHAVRRAAGRARARAAPQRQRAHHAGDVRSGDRRALVHALRGRRARRRDGQAADRRVHARQAHAGQGQARAHRRLRGRRLPHPQGRRGRRLAAARSLRRQRPPQPRRRVRRVQRQVPARAARRDATAHRERARRPSVEGVGGDAGPQRAAHAGRLQPLERQQGPVVRAGPGRARRRGHVRPARERPLPPRRAVREMAAGPHAGVVPLRAIRGSQPSQVRRAARPSPARRSRLRQGAVVGGSVGVVVVTNGALVVA